MNEKKRCPKCGHLNRPQAKFCGQCGEDMSSVPVEATPTMEDMRWRKRPGEIAARIEGRDIPNSDRGHLIIEDGATAIIMVDGELVDQPGPGRYQLETNFQRWFGRGQRQRMTALLVDTSVQSLEFELQEMWTMDPLRLSATARLAVQVKDPLKFARNVLKEQKVLDTGGLRKALFPELRDAAQIFLAEHSMEQIESNAAFRNEEFGVDIQERLSGLFGDYGLEFLRVQVFNLRHPRFDAIRQQEEDLFLGPVELENKKRLYDVFTEEQLHEIAKEETEVAHYELRAQVWERARRAVQQDRINEATSQDELDAFMAGVEQQKVLREEEMAQMRQTLTWKGEDRESERAQAVAMSQLENEYSLKGAKLAKQFADDRERLNNELELTRAETMGRLEIRTQQVELEMELETRQEELRRSQEELDDIAEQERIVRQRQTELRVQLQSATNQAEIERIRIETERLEDDNDLLTAEKAMAMMRRNREENLRIEFDADYRTKKADLDLAERQVATKLREDAQKHRQEMEIKAQESELQRLADEQAHTAEMDRISAVGSLSIDQQIIFARDPEIAKMLADLAGKRELKEMTEEQILATMVEKQPQVIEAIKARYQAAEEGKLSVAEAEKWKALAEAAQSHQDEMRDQMHDSVDRVSKQASEAAERQERMNSEALRNIRDVAMAATQRTEGGPTIVMGPSGPTTVGSTGSTAAPQANEGMRVCPGCGAMKPRDLKFCDECGHRLTD